MKGVFLPEMNSGKRRDYYRSALTAKQTASQWLHVPSTGREPLAGFTASREFFSLVSHGEKNRYRCLFARSEFGQATRFDCMPLGAERTGNDV